LIVQTINEGVCCVGIFVLLTYSPIPRLTEAYSKGLKLPKREADISHQSSAELRMSGAISPPLRMSH